VDEFTVATAVLLLLHAPVPPPNTTPETVYVVVAPIHCGVVPAVTEPALALGFKVIVCSVVYAMVPHLSVTFLLY
jgi:hypothetical protein